MAEDASQRHFHLEGGTGVCQEKKGVEVERGWWSQAQRDCEQENRGWRDPSGNAEGSGSGDLGRAGSQVRSGAGMRSVQRSVTQKTVHACGEVGWNLEAEDGVLENVLQGVAAWVDYASSTEETAVGRGHWLAVTGGQCLCTCVLWWLHLL